MVYQGSPFAQGLNKKSPFFNDDFLTRHVGHLTRLLMARRTGLELTLRQCLRGLLEGSNWHPGLIEMRQMRHENGLSLKSGIRWFQGLFNNNPMRTQDERIQSFKELWKKERGEDLTDAQALEYSDTHRPKYEIALARLFFKILWCGTFLWLFHRFLVHQPYIIYFPYKIHRDTKT